MIQSMIAMATVLAASEVVPADWRDLTSVLETFGGPDALTGATASETSKRAQLLLRHIRDEIDPVRINHWLRRVERLAAEHPSARFVTVNQACYPPNLRRAYGKPPFLFIDGAKPETPIRALAIVGSRKGSAESLAAARRAAAMAVEANITVVSGLAVGVDSAAHQGALAAGGHTIAVVGVGIDREPNPDNDPLLSSAIRQGGAIISPFRPGSPSTANTFLARNSVISGLSLVSLVFDVTEKSGTRNEADHALQQGRRVLFWKPTLQQDEWIRAYARQRGVGMVSTVSEVLDAVDLAESELESSGDERLP